MSSAPSRPICNLCAKILPAADAMRSPRLCGDCRPERPGTCACCGFPSASSMARQTGFCVICRETLLATPPGPERQVAAAEARVRAAADGRDDPKTLALESAALIDGRPWWQSKQQHYVASYTDVSILNVEAQLAAPHGWYIVETTGIGGHRSVGKIAMGAFLGGLPGMALGAGRSADTITVTWRREDQVINAVPQSESVGPLALLRQLKSMLDESLITESEYESKKRDLLQRM
ncbi:MAG: SHOCT domain-containing protein [Anaerolineaceae bacterium]